MSRRSSTVPGYVDVLDGDTGTTVFVIPNDLSELWPSNDENELFGNFMGGIARVALPSGTITTTISVPGSLRDFIEVDSGPGRNGYVHTPFSVYPVDLVTNTVGPAVFQSAPPIFMDLMRSCGNRLAFLTSNQSVSSAPEYSLHVYDTTTNLPVAGSPLMLPLATNAYQRFAIKPSTGGPTTYAVLTGASSPSLLTVEEGPLRITNTSAPLAQLTRQVEASPEGNFWITTGGGGTTFFDTSNFASLNVGPLLGANAGDGIVAPSASDTVNGVFNSVSISATALESFFIPTSPVALPISLGIVPRGTTLVSTATDR